ncbi:hypothetical protein GF386_03055 [Candidatus Pacearchaeota archaeon]|nr:hypothetical protein [Candidatus Pacearchaeota archaeon]MBD3283118.1 hypothetical protein [Candidatus Pacearchaeota archaeon]
MKNKKSQIGQTVTWFVAFIIIFFLMIIFLMATLVISGKKSLLEDDVHVDIRDSKKLEMQRILFYVLDEKISHENENLSIKELVVRGLELDKTGKADLENKLKNEFDFALGSYVDKGALYVVVIEYDLGNVEEIQERISGMRGSKYSTKYFEDNTISFDSVESPSVNDPRLSGYVEKFNKERLERGIVVNLFSDEKRVKIKFYFSENEFK